MKINNKKFIYLISPNIINKNFYQQLTLVLKTGKVNIFQMRLKKYSLKNKILIGKKIKKICKKNNVKFLVNDDPKLAKKLNADGCHLGQGDMSIKDARKIIGNKIIGVTCHNSIKMAKFAIKAKASYLAFGAFFPSKTKKTIYKASIQNLKIDITPSLNIFIKSLKMFVMAFPMLFMPNISIGSKFLMS